MKIEVIRGGKCLKALGKATKKQVGQALRVEFVTARGAKKLWAVELNGNFEGLLKTWDDCARFFRDHNCIVKIADDGDEDKGDGKPQHEREVAAKATKPKREPMRSPRVTGKREPVTA